MNLLAIDTSTEACSAALLVAGEIIDRYELAPRRHAELILPMVDSLLNEANLTFNQLDTLAFGCGPGSFTGLRIAAGVIQGFACGLDLPVVPVSSLAALAQGAYRNLGAERILAGFDARMQEVYWSVYVTGSDGQVKLTGEETVCKPAQVPLPDGTGWTGVGSAWQVYDDVLQERMGDRLAVWHNDYFPHARDVAGLGKHSYLEGKAVSAEHAVPMYIRDTVVAATKR